MIDYKDGKIVWDDPYGWEAEESLYANDQDILLVMYGNCAIDVGNYLIDGLKHQFTILVLNYADYPNEADKAWKDPYARIPCRDKADMLLQLQRAINLYPGMINGPTS